MNGSATSEKGLDDTGPAISETALETGLGTGSAISE